MPLPRKQPPTADQIAARVAATNEAIALGVKQQHELEAIYGPDNLSIKFERLMFNGGVVTGADYRPTTVPLWIADCARRGVVPFVANLG